MSAKIPKDGSLEISYLLGSLYSDHLLRVYHLFEGDLPTAIVLATVAQHNVQRFNDEIARHSHAGSSAGRSSAGPRPRAGAHFGRTKAVPPLTAAWVFVSVIDLAMYRRTTMAEFRSLVTALIASFAFPSYAIAADPIPASMPEPAAVDEEERVDEGLKRFGYLAGLARGCVVESQRAALEREALDLNAGIGRLLGIDRAFLFSSSFGYGTTVAVETKDCAEVLAAYESRVKKFRASRGDAQ